MITISNSNVHNNLLFEGISEAELLEINFDRYKIHNYSPKEILIKEGEVGNFMLLILRGEVVVTKRINNTTVVLGTRSSGDYIGEMALFDGDLRSATVISKGNTTCVSVELDQYNTLIDKFPVIKDNIMKGISKTLRSTGVKITSDKEKFLSEMKEIRNSLNETLELKRKIDEQKLELELINRELERKNKELYKLTIFDELTGAYSKKHFNNLLDSELAKSKRHDVVFSLLILDIDNFKCFNDNYGHILGDCILEGLIDNIKSLLRKEDILGRIGGEEFAIILPHMNIDESVKVGNRIKKHLNNNNIFVDNREYTVTVSIGATDSSLDNPNTVEDIIYNADTALYMAKNRGRNRIESYSTGLTMNSILVN